jgi:hypothetical protein
MVRAQTFLALTAALGSQAPTLIEVPTLAEGF